MTDEELVESVRDMENLISGEWGPTPDNELHEVSDALVARLAPDPFALPTAELR